MVSKKTDPQHDSDEEKVEVNQVFQGKHMRGKDTSLFERIFYTYAKPLLISSKE